MVSKPSERWAVVATIDPDAYTTGTTNSDYVSMEQFKNLMVVIMSGTIAANGTLNATITEAKTSTGSGAQTLATGTYNITELTTDNSDNQVLININEHALSNLYTHLRVNLVVASGAVDHGAVILGEAVRGPANLYDIASVAEIKG